MRLSLAPALLVAALAVAGCVGPTDPAPDLPAPPPALPPVFTLGEPVQVAPVPNNQVEAAVSVSEDGKTVLTCFHGLFQEPSPAYASLDGGQNWTRLALPATAGVGGDCETAITPSGMWAFLASTVAGATVLVTRDQGATWEVNPLAAIPINGLADRPWLEAVGEELWLAYMPLNFQPGTVAFTKSTDGGASWSTPVLVGQPTPTTVSVRHGHFAIGDGVAFLPMVRYGPASLDPVVQLASTTDGGATWTLEDVHRGGVVADWPSLALTQAGDLLLAYSESDAIRAFHRPPGGAWSEPFTLHDGNGTSPRWPWIAGGHGRNATFIVDGAEHEDEPHLWIGRVDAATLAVEQWPVWPRTFVEFASVDHDAAGNAYAVWTASGDAQYFVRGALAQQAGLL